VNYRSLKRIEEPSYEPVSLEEIKHHIGIDDDFTADDDYLEALIQAARISLEDRSSRTIAGSRWQMKIDFFPPRDIRLPRPPLVGNVEVWYVPVGATEHVQYEDFVVDADATPGVIRPNWNAYWPQARGAENDVIITYDAGYSNPPVGAKNCILLLGAHWYANREAASPGGMNTVPMSFDILFSTINWGAYS